MLAKYILISFLLVSCQENPYALPENPNLQLKTETKYKAGEFESQIIHLKEFNRSGQLITFTRYKDSEVQRISEFEYLDNKKIEKLTDYTDNDVLNGLIEYRSTDEGNQEIVRFDSEGNFISKELIKFDESGRVVEKSNFGSDSILSNIINYDYEIDKFGRVSLIKISDLNQEISILDSLVYDENSITRISFTPQDDNKIRTSIRYSPEGRIICEKLIDELGNVIESYEYNYTYY